MQKVPAYTVCSVFCSKNMHQRGTGGGSQKADLTPAEDIALALNKGSPVLEGDQWGNGNKCRSLTGCYSLHARNVLLLVFDRYSHEMHSDNLPSSPC